MKRTEHSAAENVISKTQKLFLGAQVFLRFSAAVASLAATCLMVTSNQTSYILDMKMDARYSYSPAFRFFVIANAVACAFSVLSTIPACLPGTNAVNYIFFLFLHDLFMMSLVLSGVAAATAIGYVGKHGNSHIGWIAICDQFGVFCKSVARSIISSSLAFLLLLILTVVSATSLGKFR